jgi:hypothetical protein
LGQYDLTDLRQTQIPAVERGWRTVIHVTPFPTLFGFKNHPQRRKDIYDPTNNLLIHNPGL